jgi:hypothetical protein
MVQAQKIYVCKDSKGKTLTSDRPIAECGDSVVREMDTSGITRREIPPPPTAEQKKRLREEEEKKKVDAARAAEQRQNDRALLARFRMEEEITIARQRNTGQAREQLQLARAGYNQLELRRMAMQEELEKTRSAKKTPPASLLQNLAESDRQLTVEARKIAQQEAEVDEIDMRYEAMLRRYRELTARPARQD